MSTVMRVAIADAVADAFEAGGARRSDILAVATSKTVSPAVLDRLAERPDQHFFHLRDPLEAHAGGAR